MFYFISELQFPVILIISEKLENSPIMKKVTKYFPIKKHKSIA